MISDVLSETVNNLDRFLNETDYYDVYTGELRHRIVQFRNEAKAIRDFLDEPPE